MISAEHPENPSRFEIQTPAAISAVRGTVFRVASQPGINLTETLRGEVEVNAQGKGLAVGAGFGTRVAKGESPSTIVKLLDAPGLPSIPVQERLTMQIPFH